MINAIMPLLWVLIIGGIALVAISIGVIVWISKIISRNIREFDEEFDEAQKKMKREKMHRIAPSMASYLDYSDNKHTSPNS